MRTIEAVARDTSGTELSRVQVQTHISFESKSFYLTDEFGARRVVLAVPPVTREEYYAELDVYCKDLYGIGINDVPAAKRSGWWANGVHPEIAVRQYGERLGLELLK